MNELIFRPIQHLFRWLPQTVAQPLYHRMVRPWIGRCPSAFEQAKLKTCPEVMMNLEPGDTGHCQIAALGVYESDLTRLITKLAVEQGGLLLDVGANYGYFSLLWCGLNPNNRSKAFEASPRVAPKLRENIALNGLEDRIEVLECAATNAEGRIAFDPGPADQTGWGGIAHGEATGRQIEVPAHRLDVFLPHEPIAFMKIDCEGADALVIEGARGLLERKLIRHVCFEENPSRMKALELTAGTGSLILRELGYQCEPLYKHEPPTEFHAWVGSR